MDTILNIIKEYGALSYAILFLYCVLKSGSLPLFAGIAANLGALDVSLVAVFVFLGGYLGDELRFYLVHKYDIRSHVQSSRYQSAFAAAQSLLNKYGSAYIFLYRYPKGMRTIGALPVALTDMLWLRFTILNFASALLWASILVGLGYLFAGLIDQYIGEYWGVISVALLLVFSVTSLFAYRRLQDFLKTDNDA